MKEMEKHLIDLYEKLVSLNMTSRKEQESKCKMKNLTEGQFKYLQLIDKHEPLTSGEFAKLTCVSKPTVTQLINRFTECGYVRKESCPTDKRVCYLHITEEGRKIARIEERAHVEVVHYIQTSLDEEELLQLISLLDKIF